MENNTKFEVGKFYVAAQATLDMGKLPYTRIFKVTKITNHTIQANYYNSIGESIYNSSFYPEKADDIHFGAYDDIETAIIFEDKITHLRKRLIKEYSEIINSELNWIEYKAGECPLEKSQKVVVKNDEGDFGLWRVAGVNWDSPYIASYALVL